MLNDMLKYTLKRVGMALLTLLIITFLLFVLVRIMPGNPFPSERMNAEQIANKRAEMGLDDPILVQFGRYMSNVLRGDFGKGTSLYNGAPISTVLSTAISNSFRIGGIAILIGTMIGLLLGITAALHKGKFLDGFCTVFSILGVCVPSYVFLIFLQYFFSFKIPFFPYFFDQNQFHGVKADYVQQIPEKDYDEVDQLADTYNRMMDMIYDNIDHITALRQQEESLKYRLLQSLINPHFLYNILDSIAACNRIGKTDLANQMIMDLTRFYRMTMHKSNELITIREELEIATLYMELEVICRGNSYSWEIHTEEDIENFLICKFTLQPFIENSIRHGMQGSGRKLHIQIDVTYGDDTIIILIRDNGHGIPADKLQELRDQIEKGEVDTSKHFGICNVSARISSELFGHGTIEINSEEEAGTTVKIEFLQLLP